MIEPDEVPTPPLAQKEGRSVTLRCRTPGEAYLVSDELEKADIIAILPEPEELLQEYGRKDYVEVQVSARAYESAADLQSVVEFQYRQLRAEQRLPHAGKLVAAGCAIMLVPGVLVFAWLLTSYRQHGYHQKAKDFKRWFFLGLAAWLLMVCGLSALR